MHRVNAMESSSKSDSTSPGSPILVDSGDLRFPTPDADSRITTWVQNITRKKMAYDSDDIFDEGILGDSAYELIDTDDESRDDNATESVSSTDYDRSDDITSFVDTECNEDNCEENSHNTCNLTIMDTNADEAFDSPTINHSPHNFLGKIKVPLFPYFEFDEYLDESNGTYSVKHTVAELDEDQASEALSQLHFDNLPKSLVLRVRQTMTKLNLSTQSPLRIFYVGDHTAQQEIIHKIISTIIPSVVDPTIDYQWLYPGSQNFNFVPKSTFWCERPPENELLDSSWYNFKIDNCHSAQNIECKENPGGPDMIKLVFDDNCACYSIPSDNGRFTIEPGRELPHLTVIFLSDSDDITLRKTITTVGEFVKRHNLPSIVISQKLILDFSLLSLEKDSVHLTLESRNPMSGEEIIQRRLPIDLASFLNIDARQMNRNLAYLTKFYEPLNNPITAKPNSKKKYSLDKNEYSIDKMKRLFWNQVTSILRFTSSYRVYLLGVFIAIMTAISTHNRLSGPSISVNNKSISTVSKLPITAKHRILSPNKLITSSISKPLVTSAKNILRYNCLSFTPGNELCLSDGTFPEGQDTLIFQMLPTLFDCTAEKFTDQEIIIRISSRIKLCQPKNQIVSLNLMRDNINIDTNRAYSFENETVLFISKDEAYGIVNILIKTPKNLNMLNENCKLDFGLPASHIWRLLKSKMSSIIPHESEIDVKYLNHIRKLVNMSDNFFTRSRVSLFRMKTLSKAMNCVSLASDTLNSTATAISLLTTKRNSAFSKNAGIKEIRSTSILKNLKKLKKPFDKRIYLAQFRSKMLWLRLKGMEEEEKRYYERAVAVRRRYLW